MDGLIENLSNEQKEKINNLTPEEKLGLDILFKVTTALIDRSINDINFSDYDYIINTDNVKLLEEKIELREGAIISYNDALNIFKNSIINKEKQSDVYDNIFLEGLIDTYLLETIKKCNNDLDKFIMIQRILNLSHNMAECTTFEGSEFPFPQFVGPTMPKFANYYADLIYKNERFAKITTDMKANAEIIRMETSDIIGNIKQNEQKHIQQLDFITEDLKNVIELTIADKNLNLEETNKSNICLKNLNLVIKKYQEISVKANDFEDIDENFKKKLNSSLSIWGKSIANLNETMELQNQLKIERGKTENTRIYKFYNFFSKILLGRNSKYKTKREISIEKKLNEKKVKSLKTFFNSATKTTKLQILNQNKSMEQNMRIQNGKDRNVGNHSIIDNS